VWALRIQEVLWQTYVNGSGSIGGISAMPSLHVASSVLLALYGFRVSRAHGWCLTAFALMIFLGSIHLGWHYAVDGYLGAAVAFGSWAIAIRLQQWQSRRLPQAI
jgi:membrane-associated phospholipid phosphatase